MWPDWVIRSGGDGVAFGERAGDQGQPHVENLDRTLPVQQQIGRLDVAVDDALGVGVGKATGGLNDHPQRLVDRQRSMLDDDVGQVSTVNVFHHQVVDAVLLVSIVGGDDIGMVESGSSLHLLVEPLDGVFGIDCLGRKNLQSNHPLHPSVQGLVDLAHTASTDHVDYGVPTEDKTLVFSFIKNASLISGELALLDQVSGESLFAGLRRQALLESVDLFGGHQTALGQYLDELIAG